MGVLLELIARLLFVSSTCSYVYMVYGRVCVRCIRCTRYLCDVFICSFKGDDNVQKKIVKSVLKKGDISEGNYADKIIVNS